MEITRRNVNRAYSDGMMWLAASGMVEDSRFGKVLVSPEPVLTTYYCPRERVLFSPKRDANPFFHLMEALWMLAGRRDVPFPTYFNSKFIQFSDDGKIFHGAYGHRWRHYFAFDQLTAIATELKINPGSRRCVLAMWDGYQDLNYAVTAGTKDAPCNTHTYFEVRDHKLEMTVCCRSNDIIWGCYGANAVHFSILQEYMANWIGVEVGRMRQFSNNFHAYQNLFGGDLERLKEMAMEGEEHDYYSLRGVHPLPLINTDVTTWTQDLFRFIGNLKTVPSTLRYQDDFFNHTACPMFRAWHLRKLKFSSGLEEAQSIAAPDWREACVNWIERRDRVSKSADYASSQT